MPDDPEFDNQTDQPSEGVVPRSHIRDLEARAKRATDAEARAAALERQLAFAQAGLPASDPRTAYFVKGYDGDLSVEAIRAAAERDGFLVPGAPQNAGDGQIGASQDTSAHSRIAGASVGADQAGQEDFFAKLKQCKSPEEVIELCNVTNYPDGTPMRTAWNSQ